jgi:aspartate kinase
MTGDPHLENDVELIRAIPYSKFLAMLNNVRPLIQKKAAEMAQQHHLKLHIRNVFSLESGTFVFPDEDQ